MAKPNYASLLGQIVSEFDPVAKQALINQCYVFQEPLTDEEKELFSYVEDGYIDANPGYLDTNFKSYVGKYFGPQGETT